MGGHDHCSVYGCSNRRSKNSVVSFFRFPVNAHRRRLWKVASQRDEKTLRITEHTKVCSVHFVTGKPSKDSKHVDFVPTLKLHKREISAKCRTSSTSKKISEWTTSVEKGHSVSANVTTPGKRCRRRLAPYQVPDIGSEVQIPLPETAKQFPVPLTEIPEESYFIDSQDHAYNASWTSAHAPYNGQRPSTICEAGTQVPKIVTSDVSSQTCSNVLSDSVLLKQKDSYIQTLKKHIHRLEDQIVNQPSSFTAKSMLTNDKSVQFWTGLPNKGVFDSLFQYLKGKAQNLRYDRGNVSVSNNSSDLKVKPGKNRKISLENEFFAVLVRLRVKLLLTDISQRLGISEAHFSKIFSTWVRFLRLELSELMRFPSLREIQKNLPPQFSRYPNTRVIIDCTEIHVEKPSSLKAQRQTWSNYKHNNTYKALVGITPDGTVCFLSNLYGGCASDKKITRECGIVGELVSGDCVMADRGFDIADLLNPKGVQLNIPPFLHAKDGQLTPEQVEETRRIAEVRIHVERAIQRIKSFQILQGTIPLSLHDLVEDIFLTCAILTIFQTPIIKTSCD
ncbi:uncharacterized protein LOC117315841 [Pecten maximus]|uniref:uncharacterized protein LOC117315841 n=1 Tax=Pecten maximus TaxID=6579 RepID=UPI0014587C5D|nr:uncharacterized protein LOC117315841 [Pecten maximus]